MNFPDLILYFFALIISLTFHEAAHAWTALRLGDDTAERMGRLSLNPLVHLDPIGTLMILTGMPLGWAKPVPVNPRNLRNPRSSMPLVSFAGPLSNFILAFIFCLIFFIVGNSNDFWMSSWSRLLQDFIQVNFSLAIFNLLPIAPLDGSNIVTVFMSARTADRFEEKMARLGIFPLMALVLIGYINPEFSPIRLWLRFWSPLVHPVLALFHVPIGFYPF